jgi:hypothetical protein
MMPPLTRQLSVIASAAAASIPAYHGQSPPRTLWVCYELHAQTCCFCKTGPIHSSQTLGCISFHFYGTALFPNKKIVTGRVPSSCAWKVSRNTSSSPQYWSTGLMHACPVCRTPHTGIPKVCRQTVRTKLWDRTCLHLDKI